MERANLESRKIPLGRSVLLLMPTKVWITNPSISQMTTVTITSRPGYSTTFTILAISPVINLVLPTPIQHIILPLLTTIEYHPIKTLIRIPAHTTLSHMHWIMTIYRSRTEYSVVQLTLTI